jgi:hypothetical protein
MPALGNRTIKFIRAQHQNVMIRFAKQRQYTNPGPLRALIVEKCLDLISTRPHYSYSPGFRVLVHRQGVQSSKRLEMACKNDDDLDLNKRWNTASISHGLQMPCGQADDVLHPCELGVAWLFPSER